MRSHDRYSEILAFVAVARRGSFIALTFCTGWLLLSTLAGTITS